MKTTIRINAGLGEISRLYDQYLEITAAILQTDIPSQQDRVSELLEKRERILGRIKEVEACLETGPDGKFVSADSSFKDADAFRQVTAEISGKLEALIKADRDIRAGLESSLENMNGERKRLARGQKTMKAYAPSRTVFSSVIDRKS